MAVAFDDDQHGELEGLINGTISSLEGVAVILSELGEESAPEAFHVRLHALQDVLVMCQTRLEDAARMLDV